MNLFEYVGKFHPLLVHLPIGILTVFVLLGFFIPRKQLQENWRIIGFILLLSALSATFSSISGYILSRSGEYETGLTANHRNLGIVLTLLTWLVFFTFKKIFKSRQWIYYSTLLILSVVMIITGHLGGSLTHGSGFLKPPNAADWFRPASNLNKQLTIHSTAFESAAIIFEQNCVVCHGENKQKGDLRLDTKEGLLKGGKAGSLLAANGSESVLLERILLPIEDDDHMPPKEKKQLTEIEISFLSWWVKNGAEFDKTLAEMNLPDSLLSIITPTKNLTVNKLVPIEEVNPADSEILEKLSSLNVLFSPIASNSNYLSVSFMNVMPDDIIPALEECSKISQQIVWLNLDYQSPEPTAWNQLSLLTGLRKLSAKNSNINDKMMAHIQAMDSLVYLNLVGTNVTASGFENIKNLKNLESIYLYQTNISSAGYNQIRKLFPQTQIDSGNYMVPTLASDTTVLKSE